MDDNTALMALAGTGVAVVTAALALSGICKDDRTRSSTSVKKSASVKKQEKLARRKLAEKKRKEDAAAATAAREAEQVKAPKPTVKKNKRKHKGKKRRGGAKASDSRGSEDDLQAKYAISMEDDDGVGEWAQVTKVVTRTKSKRRDNQESASNIADESSASPARVERETQVTMLLHGCAPAVIGRGGSTVRDIQNNSGAKLKIDKETDRLTIIGTTEEIQVAKSLVEEVISNNSADKQSSRHAIRLSVPADRIGAVIGKGGSNIHIIESQTNCRLKMDRDANQVSISGDNMDDVTRAKTLVQESIEREGNSNRGVSYYGHEGPLGATVDLLSRQGCLAIIGRGGTTIQQIESESGARIKVDKESNVCELRGTDEQVEAARASILDVIAQLSPENVMTIPLTSKTIGTVIGRGGNTIQRIQDESGARLDIKRSADSATLHISGSPEAVAEAKREVETVLNEQAERQNQSRKGQRILLENEVEDSVEYPSADYIGVIIGRGGSTIQQIEGNSGARLDIQRESNSVRISGPPEAVSSAKEEVLAIIAKRTEELAKRNVQNVQNVAKNQDANGWDAGDDDAANGW